MLPARHHIIPNREVHLQLRQVRSEGPTLEPRVIQRLLGNNQHYGLRRIVSEDQSEPEENEEEPSDPDDEPQE